MEELKARQYKAGFITDILSDTFELGLSEDVIRMISSRKNEPKWLLDYRLDAFAYLKTLTVPNWANLDLPPIDFSKISFYSEPKKQREQTSSSSGNNNIDPAILETFEKLGIPLTETDMISNVAIDAVFDSVSVGTTFKDELLSHGVIFCSISEAVREHEELVKQWLGKVVSYKDNYFATLNAAVFSDGTFAYIPRGVTCPKDLSTYFRINAEKTGQFERTLIVADENSFVNYLEGCTAPQRDENQLHAAVVELVALDNANINYSTVQNWYPGDEEGRGGIYNLVTKRGNCLGKNSKISWTQVEVGSAITWKYPSCLLTGENSEGSFYSVALTNNKMQADTGTKMIHIGKNSKSKIISKGISAEESKNSYRGLVKIMPSATNSQNYTQCDSMLIGSRCSANTYPYIEVMNNKSKTEHEATTSKISAEQINYLLSRGLSQEKAISLIINGFCADVFNKLPLEFASEAVRLLEMKLENSVG